jgi:hypothetical protein
LQSFINFGSVTWCVVGPTRPNFFGSPKLRNFDVWATQLTLLLQAIQDPEELDCVLKHSNDPIILQIQPAEFNIIPSIRAQLPIMRLTQGSLQLSIHCPVPSTSTVTPTKPYCVVGKLKSEWHWMMENVIDILRRARPKSMQKWECWMWTLGLHQNLVSVASRVIDILRWARPKSMEKWECRVWTLGLHQNLASATSRVRTQVSQQLLVMGWFLTRVQVVAR